MCSIQKTAAHPRPAPAPEAEHTVEIDADLWAWLVQHAAQQGRDPLDVLHQAAREELARHGALAAEEALPAPAPLTVPGVLRTVLGVALDRDIGEEEDLFALLSQWIRAMHERKHQPERPALARGARCLIVDSGAALARYAFTEAKRRGFLPRGLSLDAWMADAVHERAHLLTMELIGIDFDARFSARPELREDSEGGEVGLRSYHMAG